MTVFPDRMKGRIRGLVLMALCALAALCVSPPVHSDGSLEAISRLIERLGDSSWSVREDSQRALIALGAEAVGHLTVAAASAEPEVAFRAKLILGRVDPLVVRVRIQRIALEAPPRIVETLESEGISPGDNPGEVLLPERLDPSDRTAGYAAQYRPLPPQGLELSLEETTAGSAFRNPLPASPPAGGAVGILKRGEEARYRQIGCNVERKRYPFLTILRWWAAPRSRLSREQGGPSTGADLEGLVKALLSQARSDDAESRLAALEVLGLLPAPEAGEVFRSAALAPSRPGEPLLDANCRMAALAGLTRLGDPQALRSLREILSEQEAAGDPSPAGEPEARPAASIPPVAGARTWENRAALAMIEAGDRAGFEHFARRIADVPPSEIHRVLAIIADEVHRAPADVRELLVEALSVPEILVHLPWDDPEVEHFYGKLFDHVEGPRRAELGERLLRNLSHALCSDSGMGSARSRTFAGLWERITRDSPPAGLAPRLLKEILDRGGSPLRLNEVVAWVGPAFRDQPMPQADFERLLALIRKTLKRSESDNGFSGGLAGGSFAALEVARGPALSERQVPELAGLMAELVGSQNQSYQQDLYLEIERLTGLSVNRRSRPTPPRPVPVTVTVKSGDGPVKRALEKDSPDGPPEVLSIETAARPPAGPPPSAEALTPLEQVARWAADPEAVSAAHRRLRKGLEEASSPPDAIEYWEFMVRLPGRPQGPQKKGTPRSFPQANPAATGGESPRPEVLWGTARGVLTGAPYELTDAWMNRINVRIDLERAGATSRYRLNGQVILDADLPVYVTLRDREMGFRWYEASDVRLGPTYLSKRYPERLLRLVCIRKSQPGSAPLPTGTPELWEEFWRRFFDGLSGRSDDKRIQSALGLMRDLDLPEGEKFLRAELKEVEPRRRLQAAQVLAGSCDLEGVRELMAIVRERPKAVAIDGALIGLDAFLGGCGSGSEESRQVLDVIFEKLHEPDIQPRGFPMIAREAGTDFAYRDTLRLNLKQGRKEAQAKAVEDARRWWASHRSAGSAPK